MIDNIRKMRERQRQQLAFSYLHEKRAEYLTKYPQLCCLSFDHIGIVVAVHGRMDDAFLDWVEERFGPDLAGKTVLDVGANIGNHTLAFSKIAKKVVAFEPQDTVHELCVLNARHADNIEVLKLGASDKAATVHAAVRRDAYGSTRITETPDANEIATSFEVVPLDTVMGERSDEVGLIKIDVEGHEPEALRGAQATIERHQPVVIIEQDRAVIANGTSPAIDILRGYGYDIHEPVIESHGGSRLPGPVAKIARRVKHAVSGYDAPRFHLERRDRLATKTYPYLICLPKALG